ncbi:MAG: hypothetical protein IH586_07055 [Anaerolineaceae bacterium]|nr:hypothetical protein [Anaerolineaceae bacterium]
MDTRQIFDQPAHYEIILSGRLGDQWASTFEGMVLRVETQASGRSFTILSGMVDQSGLHGLLSQIRDLGLPLISVKRQ